MGSEITKAQHRFNVSTKVLVFILSSVLFLSLAAQATSALQEVAGPITFTVPIGGTVTARWGLLNDENQTLTVGLSSLGNATQYLSFPQTVDLQPGKVLYVNVTASIPADYDVSNGRNITGALFALQEGAPGQVQINIEISKMVTIVVIGQSNQTSQTSQTSQQTQPVISSSQSITQTQTSTVTGLSSLVSSYPVAIALLIGLVVIAFAYFKTHNPRANPRKNRR